MEINNNFYIDNDIYIDIRLIGRLLKSIRNSVYIQSKFRIMFNSEDTVSQNNINLIYGKLQGLHIWK